jgi:hypothetical protein
MIGLLVDRVVIKAFRVSASNYIASSYRNSTCSFNDKYRILPFSLKQALACSLVGSWPR